MAKKVLILSGSPRKDGNSDVLCDEFAKGAREAGNEVKKIRISEKKINYCTGCYYCQKSNGECAIKDDMAEILDDILSSDVIVLASPVYFYSIDAQLKTVIDRIVAKWLQVKNKEFYYIMTAAENSAHTFNCTLECFRGLAACLSGSIEKGVLKAGGVYQKGEVQNTPYVKQAYEMGKAV